MWPVKLIQNYWSSEGEAPKERMRHDNTKDVFMEKWITQNTKPQPEIESRWWKAKEKDHVKAAFHHQAGRRAFKTSTQLPQNRGGLISLEGVPCGQDRTETVLCLNLHKVSQHHERQSVNNSKFLCSQKHTQLWSSLLQVITKAWEIQLALSQTVFDSLLITIMSLSRRCSVGFLRQKPWGKNYLATTF